MASDPRAREVKRHIAALFDELLAHDGFGTLTIDMRLLRRGQKEVILHCGKQYRYVLDFTAPAAVPATGDDAGSCASTSKRHAPLHDPVAGGRGHILRG